MRIPSYVLALCLSATSFAAPAIGVVPCQSGMAQNNVADSSATCTAGASPICHLVGNNTLQCDLANVCGSSSAGDAVLRNNDGYGAQEYVLSGECNTTRFCCIIEDGQGGVTGGDAELTTFILTGTSNNATFRFAADTHAGGDPAPTEATVHLNTTWLAGDGRDNRSVPDFAACEPMTDPSLAHYHARDRLYGSSGGCGDVIYGAGDPDQVLDNECAENNLGANGHDDLFDGGDHREIVVGATSHDDMAGGADDDNMCGDLVVTGTAGTDHCQLHVKGANHVCEGGESGGNDDMAGGDDDDCLDGGKGNDRINGDDGVDIMRGHDDEDQICDDGADDKYFGEDDDDEIFTDGTFDTLDCGADDDVADYLGTNCESDALTACPI